MNTRNIKVACEVVIIENNMILLGKRKKCYGAGDWGLPGGHLEENETALACAKRELKEEVNLVAHELKLISVTDSFSERGHYLHISFLLEKFSGKIQNMEPDCCSELQFFDLNQLPENIFKPHQNILKNYIENTLYAERDNYSLLRAMPL